MSHSAVGNRLFASLLLVAVALLVGACVKLPRHTSIASRQTFRQETPGPALVHLNTASADELEKLPGIGRALAARIVAYRQQQGRFRRAEHLIIIRGISDRRFRAMRALVTVE